MMYDHEKSDFAIVAGKPTNKAGAEPFFRPDRQIAQPSRAGPVKAGRVPPSRLRDRRSPD
jgi:hypothetical protein